jgi:hypothetical protein
MTGGRKQRNAVKVDTSCCPRRCAHPVGMDSVVSTVNINFVIHVLRDLTLSKLDCAVTAGRNVDIPVPIKIRGIQTPLPYEELNRYIITICHSENMGC